MLESTPGTGFTLRAISATGEALGTDAAQLTVTEQGATCEVTVSATSPELLAVEIAYDPGLWHPLEVECGGYFAEPALYLAVLDTPGVVTLGGCPLEGSTATDTVVGRVTMAAGPADHAVSQTELPVGDTCVPWLFDYTDNGDGSVTFTWQYHNVGDYNQDGLVYVTDITPVGQHYDKNYTSADWPTAQLADGNGDNYITVADLTPIGQNYQTGLSGYKVEHATSESGAYGEIATVMVADGVAEPKLTFSSQLSNPVDGEWYRVRAYHADDASQGAATAAVQLRLLPPGDNPVAVPSADVVSGDAPLTVNLSDGGSYDNDGTIVQWLWDLDNDYVYELDATAETGSVTHIFSEPGMYCARLKVVDNDGRSGNDALVISVAGASEPPLAYAYATPNQGWAPLTVYVSPFGSTDPDGTIASWEWDLDGDGLYETNATADEGYAEHTFTSAGDYVVRLKMTDDTLVSSVASVTVSVRDPAESTVDYWSVFDDSTVRRVDLIVSQQNWNTMWIDVNAEVEVEADAVVFGTSLPSIGLRMKGNSSLTNPSRKKPWKIDTNAFDDTQDFANLKMLIFNNEFKDPSLAREHLAYEMLAQAGAHAGHTCFVEIWITIEDAAAEFWGVYTMVERVDKKYLENRFADDGGNLYKGYMGADLSWHGSDINAYPLYEGEPCYGKKTNEEEADYGDLINLLDVINNTTDENFTAELEQVFNVDSYLRYLAATLTHSNLDIEPYMSQNFYLYHNPATGRFEWIAWDLNEAWGQFGNQDANLNHPVFELADGVQGVGTPHDVLFERVMEQTEYRRAYAAYVDLLLRQYFVPEDIGAKALAVHDLVEDYVRQGDKMFVDTGAMYTYDMFDQDWQADVTSGLPGPGAFAFGMQSFTQARRNYIEARLLTEL
ncbi:CotH kinase family protein [bacterium]|nr:CotH kinase family protein [bacterium]